MEARALEHRGFTLIELLIVVVIIGILATIALPKFASVREDSYVATVILDLKSLAAHQEIYHGDNLTYAANTASLPEMVVTTGVNISINEADGFGWAATAFHDAAPARPCGIFFGAASAANGSPATAAGNITCLD
jgi:prepilin-type N-terminal cleavage/methylation domain-containing protein